jgi:membrane-bound lytic murein transglycosylase B
VFAIDLDKDGDTDVLVTVNSAAGYLMWYENTGTGSFTSHVIVADKGVYAVHAADMDGDGKRDSSSSVLHPLLCYVWHRTFTFLRL